MIVHFMKKSDKNRNQCHKTRNICGAALAHSDLNGNQWYLSFVAITRHQMTNFDPNFVFQFNNKPTRSPVLFKFIPKTDGRTSFFYWR